MEAIGREKSKVKISSHFSVLTQNHHSESELKSDLKNSKNRFLYFCILLVLYILKHANACKRNRKECRMEA